MALIVDPYTAIAAAIIRAAETNARYTTIYNDYNGGITDANVKTGANINANKLLAASITSTQLANAAITDAKIDYSSVLLLKTIATGLKVARGATVVALVAQPNKVQTILFSTAIGGNPNFSAPPTVVATIETAGGAVARLASWVENVAAAQFDIEVDNIPAVNITVTVTVHWIAIGA